MGWTRQSEKQAEEAGSNSEQRAGAGRGQSRPVMCNPTVNLLTPGARQGASAFEIFVSANRGMEEIAWVNRNEDDGEALFCDVVLFGQCYKMLGFVDSCNRRARPILGRDHCAMTNSPTPVLASSRACLLLILL